MSASLGVGTGEEDGPCQFDGDCRITRSLKGVHFDQPGKPRFSGVLRLARSPGHPIGGLSDTGAATPDCRWTAGGPVHSCHRKRTQVRGV